jgi:hypothetical protein
LVPEEQNVVQDQEFGELVYGRRREFVAEVHALDHRAQGAGQSGYGQSHGLGSK